MRLDPSRDEWMRAVETRAVMDALTAQGGDARFVGGAVRNSLLHLPVQDIDIATPLVPNEVVRRLSAANIVAVPTGIEHGTITAVANGKPFEVTTLRRDVATDGRHATVAFSLDWEEDAARRDFTINALYASFEGEVFDYAGGIADLESGHIRFIGEPSERIHEDYLRILRLFRFHAWYGRGELDGLALQAAEAERANLKRLSGERIQKELLRLLEAENPIRSLQVMADAGILAEVHPALANLEHVERLVAIDTANFFRPDAMLRLAAILPADDATISALADRLRLSNLDRGRLMQLTVMREPLSPDLHVREVRQLLYQWGTQPFRDRVLLDWANDPQLSNTIAWRALLALADAWICPTFPLSGRDIMAAGVPEGPLVGRVLSDVEAWWVANDFAEDPSALAETMTAAVQKYAK